jgi:transcriptional regulator with XRE-family HTH domain
VVAKRTALGTLLQERREAVGFSRTRLGELVGIKSTTIEAWELGRVTKPPIHDVLTLARFLGISFEELEAAVLRDRTPPSAREPRPETVGAVPLLEQAIELFAWSEEQIAAALHTTPEQIAAWRRGAETMPLPELMTVAALVGLHAAGAVGEARIADVARALASRPRQRSG